MKTTGPEKGGWDFFKKGGMAKRGDELKRGDRTPSEL